MCGGVRFRTGQLRDVWNCHCVRCRRWTGHHMAATGAPATAVRFDADSTLRWHSPAPTVEYGFCAECGSSLFWRTSSEPGWLSISAGAIDQPTGLRTTKSWWTAEHADYHPHDPGVAEVDYED
jgi:hypothetical protein